MAQIELVLFNIYLFCKFASITLRLTSKCRQTTIKE